MTEDQLSKLWAFASGDTAALDFEKWFLAQDDLEGQLREGLHWSLASASYTDRDEVWKLRKSLAQNLEPHNQCECASIRDLAAIPMGGDGLNDENTSRIFKAFYSTKSSGMGVGLAVSRSILENHRGRLWATPNEGQGATFSFSIPGSDGSPAGPTRNQVALDGTVQRSEVTTAS
ncbi:MAG TPA: ATP-binding protein [Sphingomicrobium sp.]|nr:ATP-binding protein [Sphingomicrobium sp.]